MHRQASVFKCFITASLFCFVLLQFGCGSNLTKTNGTLKVDGKIVGNATITFYPVGGGRPGTAYVGEDGTFVASYRKPGDGLPPGDYKVAIIGDEVSGGRASSEDEEGFGDIRRVKKLVPKIYNNIRTTPLTKTVGETEKVFDLDITTK